LSHAHAESAGTQNSPETAPEVRARSSAQTSDPPLTAEEQQHSLVISTKHDEEGAFVVEIILHNLPPAESFVVKWEYPLLLREGTIDASRWQQSGRRPTHYTPETLLQALRDQRLSSSEWKRICSAEYGVSHGKFFELLKRLQEAGKVQKSVLDGKMGGNSRAVRKPQTISKTNNPEKTS
jgi:hypothetical protein